MTAGWRNILAGVYLFLWTGLLTSCGGGGGGGDNPFLPSLTSLSPASATAGDPALTLTVNGSNFLSDSVVCWNDSPRTTTFVSSSQLTAAIPDSDLAAAGTAQVTICGEGSALFFTITTAPPPGSSIERVSVANDGTQSNADSDLSSVSADGRFVAFASVASNLVADDTNGVEDIFVRDTCVGATACTPSTIRASMADDGAEGNSQTFGLPSISADGRFVAFRSLANNLVAGDDNGADDIFVRDTCVGATGCTRSTIRVSMANDSSQSNGDSSELSISADGRFVAFASFASNLVAGDTNGSEDDFVRDTCVGATGCTPSTIRVSVASDGTQGNSSGVVPSISADGRFVAFESFANNMVAGDTNGSRDIFLRDTCVGATGCTPLTIRVSVAGDGSQGTSASGQPSISADGRFVAYHSDASNLVSGDTNGLGDIFVRDTCVGAGGCAPSTIRVSVANDGTEGNSQPFGSPAISADGRFVAFPSVSTNLVTGDTNGFTDVFVRDTCAGATGCTPSTSRVSVADDGTQANERSLWSSISADGRFVAFASEATNLVAGDTNGRFDIFVRDTCAGATGCTPSTIRVSLASDGAQGNNVSFLFTSISRDGRFVAFVSFASNLVAGDTNDALDIFLARTGF